MTALLLGLAAVPFIAKIAMMGAQGYLLQSLYKVFQLLIPAAWRWKNGMHGIRVLWPAEEPLPSWKMWMTGIAVAFGLSGAGVGALLLLAPLLGIDPSAIRAGMDARFSVGPAAALCVVVFLSFANSALEELHFRAWLDRGLSARMGSIAGIGVSAAAFGAMHGLIFLGLPGIPPAVAGLAAAATMLCGVCWSLLMRGRGGIHAAWLSHGLTDVLLLGWGLGWLGYL